MSDKNVHIDAVIGERLLTFQRSELFTIKSTIAKSEYWKHQAGQLRIINEGGSVGISGESGFYVPPSASYLRRTVSRAIKAIKSPKKIVPWIHGLLMSRFSVPRLMSYDQAFDAVMHGDVVSDPDCSRFLINHVNLSKLAGVLPDYASVQSYYSAWSGYQASANVINQYYYANILRKFVKPDEVRTVMEIGSGSGNFASIIHHDWVPTRVILVDLPETLAVAIPFLSSLFPKAQLLMPHEVSQKGLNSKFDFAFLTVDQVDSIKENSVDLVINCHSFQEMTHDQIDSYFRLVQKICKPAGLFFVANRIEKIPCGEDAFTTDQVDPPNRFAEYPWNPRNHDLVYEISKLSRLVQLDPIAIRLQRIIK